MEKTSLYLDPEGDRAVDLRALSEGITKAELVRLVLVAAVFERPRARGVFDGPRDLGSEAERYLSETGFRDGRASPGATYRTSRTGVRRPRGFRRGRVVGTRC